MAFLCPSPLAVRRCRSPSTVCATRATPTASLRVAVVGAGTAGAALALALHRRDIQVTLFERAPTPRTAQCGVVLRSQALDALESCGLADVAETVVAAGLGISAYEFKSIKTDAQLMRADAPPGPSGRPDLSLRRADVLDALVAPFLAEGGTLCSDTSVSRVEQDARSASLHLEPGPGASGGDVRSGDVVVGADGTHSVVAAAVAPDRRLFFLSDRVWRGVARTDGAFGEEVATSCVLRNWTREDGLFAGTYDVDGAHTHWGVFQDAGHHDAAAARREDASNGRGDGAGRGVPAEVLALLPTVLRGVVERTHVDDVGYELTFDNDPLDCYVRGRVALIGDAAHSMSSTTAWGMGAGICDAACLANLLVDEADCRKALQLFDAERREPTQKNQAKARQMDQAKR